MTIINEKKLDDLSIGDKWFNNDLKDIYDNFKTTKTIDKQELYDILPNNFKTDAKIAIFKKLDNNVTEKAFIKFLRKQTIGADYISFDYLVRYYKLEMDKNYMPIFTNKFQFDKSIKKEALFIWSILKNIETNVHLSRFDTHYLNVDLQAKLESEDMSDLRKMKYDLHFTNLDIIVEIDENHKGLILIADNIKNCLMSQNGISFIRLNFQKIYNGEIVDNANDEILNSEYYTKFIRDLNDKLTNSLLHKYREVREYYIMHIFKNTLVDKINNSMLILIKYLNAKKLLTSSDKIAKLDKKIKQKNKVLIEAKIHLEGLSENSNFIAMFNYKDRCKKNLDNKTDKKVITFDEIIKLLEISPDIKNDITNFKEFLYDINIIDDSEIDNDTIFVNWKQLTLILLEYDSNNNLQSLLKLYFIELEESYEKIIDLIEKHNICIRSSREAFQICMENANIKLKKDFINDVTKAAKVKYTMELDVANKTSNKYKKLYEKSEMYRESQINKFVEPIKADYIPLQIEVAKNQLILDSLMASINLDLHIDNKPTIVYDSDADSSDADSELY